VVAQLFSVLSVDPLLSLVLLSFNLSVRIFMSPPLTIGTKESLESAAIEFLRREDQTLSTILTVLYEMEPSAVRVEMNSYASTVSVTDLGDDAQHVVIQLYYLPYVGIVVVLNGV
jgi:hypothetical protein